MKKITVLLLCLLILCGCAGTKTETTTITDTNETVSFLHGPDFSLSFWYKPSDNSFYQEIISLEDEKQSLTLFNNSQDEEWHSTGLSLSHTDGFFYKDGDFKLTNGIWSYIVLSLDGKSVSFYLDGRKVTEGKLSKKLLDNTQLKFFDNGEYRDMEITSLKNEEAISEEYRKNITYKLEALDFSDAVLNNQGGTYALPRFPYEVEYIADSDLIEIEDSRITFSKVNKEEAITLRAKTIIDEEEYTKDFNIVISPVDKTGIEELEREIKNRLSNGLSESDQLINEKDGYVISYKVLSGNAIFDETTLSFKKTEAADEKEHIQVQVSIHKENEEIHFNQELVLLDRYVGYVIAYFNGSEGWPDYEVGEETLYFAYSEDLENWTQLNKEPIVFTSEGSGRFRDPYISRNENGDFVLVTTEGYYNPGIYVIESKDLKNFNCKEEVFNNYDDFLGLSGDITWAPEYIYNTEKECYTIVFADGNENANAIYAVDTKDFHSFSDAYILLYAGYHVIDPDIQVINGQYVLFFKDESSESTNLYYGVSPTMEAGSFRIYDEQSLSDGKKKEGSFVLYDYEKNVYRIYMDGYNELKVYSGILSTESDPLYTEMNVDEGLTALTDVRHFSIVPITEKERDVLLSQ